MPTRRAQHRPLPKNQVLAEIAGCLKRMGFWLVGRNQDRSSYYLRRPQLPFKLRISDHKMTWVNQLKSPEIVKSVIVTGMPAKDAQRKAAEIAAEFDAECLRRSNAA